MSNKLQGSVHLANANGNETIILNTDGTNVHVGGHGHNGDIRMLDNDGNLTIHIDGGNGNILY